MKTLLIYPRFWPHSSPPLGLAYVAPYMRKSGLDVEVVDCTFNTDKERLIGLAKKINPDVIGIGFTTDFLVRVKEIVPLLREALPGVIIIAGGSHPCALPEETLTDYDFDIVVKGEGERITANLIKTLQNKGDLSKVRGIYYKENNKVMINAAEPLIEDISELPFPARDMLSMEEYIMYSVGRSSWSVPSPSTTVIGTRGCPYNCTFCATNINYGKKIRRRSAKNYADEIEEVVKKYHLKGIWFNDDSFTMDKGWVLEIFNELEKRNVNIKWGCNTRVNLVDEELLKDMKRHGCEFISFGVESGVQEVLDKYIRKGITLDQVRKAFALCNRIGIFTQATFMVGVPGETIANMEQTIRFAKEINPDCVQVSIATPFPKTELVELAKRIGKVKEFDWEKLDFMEKGVIHTDEFTPDEVRSMQKRFLREFYFRPAYRYHQISKINSFYELKKKGQGR